MKRTASARAARLEVKAVLALLAIVVLAACGQTTPEPAAAPVQTLSRTEPLIEHTRVPAGTAVRAALRVPIPDRLHIQSNAPREAGLIATELTFAPPAGVEVRGVVFPAATDLSLPGYDLPLAVFEHELVIGVELAIDAAQAPGPVVLPARLRYQACDDRQCFLPRSIDTAWRFEVVPADAALSAPLYPDTFGAIRFGTGTKPPIVTELPADVRQTADADGRLSATETLALFDRFEIRGTGAYMTADEFLTFIRNAEAGVTPKGLFEDRGILAIVAIVFLGGLALNLTPCVLPMIPINLAIIGAGAQGGRRSRGLFLGSVYGGAMALTYGLIGLVVILTAGTFGSINASPWFNAAIALLFLFLALAMFDVITIDFSRLSSRIRFSEKSRGTALLAFGMGTVAALLAGACVAPVVIQVVVFAADQYAAGVPAALALPFVLGLGMALPWPIAGAGISALPKPGAWMVRVKQVMGVFILATAVYYGYTAWLGFDNLRVDPGSVSASVQEQIEAGWHADLVEGLETAQREGRPVLVDFWATWCKNCLVMDRTTLVNPAVVDALSDYVKIKVQAEDPTLSPTREILQRLDAPGLPAYAILHPR